MNVNSRFLGEYALTGAFFWVAQFIVWITIDPDKNQNHGDEELVVDQVTRILGDGVLHLPKAIQDSNLAIVFLALIVVFFTGLVLDLLKVAFRPLEMDKFMDHVERANLSNSWLDHKIKNHCPYDEEYKQLCEYRKKNSQPLRNWLLVFIPGIVLVSRSIRAIRRIGGSIGSKARTNGITGSGLRKRRKDSVPEETAEQPATTAPTVHDLIPHYVKLHAFLLSFVLVHSDQTNLEPLTQGTRLWRSSREISVAVLILLVEVICIAVLVGLSKLVPLSDQWSSLLSHLSLDKNISWIKPTTLEWHHILLTFVALSFCS